MSCFIGLERAVLCIDCEIIFEINRNDCPKCEGKNYFSLARFLNREEQCECSCHNLSKEVQELLFT